MRSGVHLGRVFGINVRLDWSWLFIFFLVTWNLATAFGNIHADWGVGLQVGVALAAALLFFASVLAHELAHSLMAEAQGVPVRGITLFLFGGVSNIQRNPPSPLAEFLITIVGPITSVALGILFILFSGVGLTSLGTKIVEPVNLVAEYGPITTLLLWLGPVNLILGVFNLVPGFPLDGGRILRSILWGITDNLRDATRWASWVGQGVAWLMITAGVAMVFGANVPLFGTGLVDGLWLAFIGWFLNSAAVRSYQQIAIEDILEGVQVQTMMRTEAPTVEPGDIVNDLVHGHIMKSDDHAFPVVEGDHLVGLVTLEDVRAVPRDQWRFKSVSDIMTPKEEIISVSAYDDAAEAFDKLSRLDVRQLPVVHEGTLVGVLRRRDIVRWLQFHSKGVLE